MRAVVLSLALLGPVAARSPVDDIVGPLFQEASALRASVDPKMKRALAVKLTSIIIPSSLSSDPGLLGLENSEAVALMTNHDDAWRAAHQVEHPRWIFLFRQNTCGLFFSRRPFLLGTPIGHEPQYSLRPPAVRKPGKC